MRCKHCKIKFDVKWFNQKYCLQNDECISASIEFAKGEIEKAKAKKRRLKLLTRLRKCM